MTRKEFSKKYSIDYQLVVSASRRLQINTKRAKDVQFSENDLGIAVCIELNERITKAEKSLLPLMEDYDRMRTICWKVAL